MALDTDFERAGLEHQQRMRSPLGLTIQMLRKRANLSQTQLAGLAGLSQVTVSKVEQHAEQSSIATIRAITDALGEPLHKVLRFADQVAIKHSVERADSPTNLAA